MARARKSPTLAQAEQALGEPAAKWAGRCYEIACALVQYKLVPDDAVAVYGHWLGPVAPGSHFDRGNGLPFVQHGWVLLADGSVVDPTRWVFEGVAPYIYAGPSDHYDEGGNEWRESREGTPPEFDPDGEIVTFTKRVMPSADAWNFVEKLLGLRDLLGEEDYEAGTMTRRQLFWLANRSPKSLGPHAFAVYAAVCKLGERALIPIDNLRKVEREFRADLPD